MPFVYIGGTMTAIIIHAAHHEYGRHTSLGGLGSHENPRTRKDLAGIASCEVSFLGGQITLMEFSQPPG